MTRKKWIVRVVVVGAVVAAIALLARGLLRQPDDENPLTAGSEQSIPVLEFSSLADLDTLPSGWTHRSFWFTPAMELSLQSHQGAGAIQCKTDGGGSILGRNTDISLAEYPLLSWDWFIEQPIDSDVDERTEEGDDHPARLLIRFEDSAGEPHFVEIIWSNRLFAPGDYKYIDDFAHYVANGLDENIGRWHHQQVDLMEIYQTTTKLQDNPQVKMVAIFCDSDNTGGQSSAYFSDVSLARR